LGRRDLHESHFWLSLRFQVSHKWRTKNEPGRRSLEYTEMYLFRIVLKNAAFCTVFQLMRTCLLLYSYRRNRVLVLMTLNTACDLFVFKLYSIVSSICNILSMKCHELFEARLLPTIPPANPARCLWQCSRALSVSDSVSVVTWSEWIRYDICSEDAVQQCLREWVSLCVSLCVHACNWWCKSKQMTQPLLYYHNRLSGALCCGV
jgi:hypothetical protein